MKLSLFTVLVFCGFFSQAFIGQNVQVVVGQKVEFGRRQPIPPPEIGLPATPMASLASPAPSSGISAAGRIGISSNIEFQQGVESTLSPATLAYQNATMWSVPETPAAIQGPLEETRPADLGLSFFVGAKSLEKEPSVSLGEVAARYKAVGRSKNVRSYTNID